MPIEAYEEVVGRVAAVSSCPGEAALAKCLSQFRGRPWTMVGQYNPFHFTPFVPVATVPPHCITLVASTAPVPKGCSRRRSVSRGRSTASGRGAVASLVSGQAGNRRLAKAAI